MVRKKTIESKLREKQKTFLLIAITVSLTLLLFCPWTIIFDKKGFFQILGFIQKLLWIAIFGYLFFAVFSASIASILGSLGGPDACIIAGPFGVLMGLLFGFFVSGIFFDFTKMAVLFIVCVPIFFLGNIYVSLNAQKWDKEAV